MHSPRFETLCQQISAHVREVSIHDVKQKMDQGSLPFCLIDVREESEWHKGHIPHAIHIGKGVIERDIEKVIPDVMTPLILYCGGGYRSALAADNLQKMGYQNVLSMAGGYRAWMEAKYPLMQ